MSVIDVYRQRQAKPQQPYPGHVSSHTKQPRHGRAGDCCISTSISEATANRPRRRSSNINSNQRSNSQYDSRANNCCISTATVINDYQRRLARQQRQHICVGYNGMLASTRKSKALISSDQQTEAISGTALAMMVAYTHSRVSATAVYPH